ncbi:MAG TPA: serine hydrolase domain-containing protein, partial [Limnochordia bacterium]|nr:serine hydrolase domain-containing protein [Limnochordia bacterium]
AANVYQSMGFVVLSTLIERLSGLPFADFVRTELFARIGMVQSDFGRRAGCEPANEVQVALPADQIGTDFHWNSAYWRSLGAPWGGLITTARDLALFLGEFVTPQHIAPGVAQAMTHDALAGTGPEFAPWGLGFKLKGAPPGTLRPLADAAQTTGRTDSFTSPGAAHGRSFFGELTSAATFGHSGATGCAMWVDPTTGLGCVLLTDTPGVLRDGTLVRAANMIKSCESPLG